MKILLLPFVTYKIFISKTLGGPDKMLQKAGFGPRAVLCPPLVYAFNMHIKN